ncbi:hypothetical protein RUM44_006057 [Polyplax serrata]|uniref:Uncharacterized protein n=1 Tax=Polyplax serrata TaxID=468196 RepID=A0ABR1AZI5_POLSC
MMPIKEILALKPIIPGPPVLVIDEKTIRETSDAGPVCGCQEKYNMIQEYKPFLPGDDPSLVLSWQKIKLGSDGPLLDKPIPKIKSQMSEKDKKIIEESPEELMFVTPPRYNETYYQRKMMECPRDHYNDCDCPEN